MPVAKISTSNTPLPACGGVIVAWTGDFGPGYVLNVLAFAVARRNRFLGRWLAHGEGYPDWNVRLFDRRRAIGDVQPLLFRMRPRRADVFGRGIDGEPVGPEFHRRQAAAGAGDGRADVDPRGIKRGGDPQPHIAALLGRSDGADGGDDSGKHQVRS